MSEWMSWFGVAGIVVVLELFSGTFYLLMIGIGLASGGLAALLGLSSELQFIIAGVIGVVATVILRRSRFGLRSKVDATRDPNVNLDIGQTLQIASWNNVSDGVYSARSMHRGAMWDIQFKSPQQPRSGMFKIVEIQGSQLIVEPVVS